MALLANAQVVPKPTRNPATQPSTQSRQTPQKIVTKRPESIVENIMFSLEVRLLSGDINVNQQWGAEKVVYQPERLSFRYRPLTTGAATAEWQVARRPFLPNDRSGEATGLVASGSAGRVPVMGSRIFFIDAADFMPAAPPKQPIVYYVRLLARNAANGYYGGPSKSVRIVYRADTSDTRFTELGLLDAPRIDRVDGFCGVDAGNRPILVSGKSFRIHGRSFPQKEGNLQITFLSEGKGQVRATVEEVTGSDNDMTIDATMNGVSNPGVYNLELAVVDGDITRYKTKTLVALARSPRFTIIYKGLRCLEETNEVGSDEPYTIFLTGRFSTRGIDPVPGAVHSNVDQGESHPANVTLRSNWELLKGDDAFIMVGLMENDDGFPKGIMNEIVNSYYNKSIVFETGDSAQDDDWHGSVLESYVNWFSIQLSDAARAQENDYLGFGVFNADDLVEVKPLRLSDTLLRECQLSLDAKTIYLDMAGDGGKYRLEFSIKAGTESK